MGEKSTVNGEDVEQLEHHQKMVKKTSHQGPNPLISEGESVARAISDALCGGSAVPRATPLV